MNFVKGNFRACPWLESASLDFILFQYCDFSSILFQFGLFVAIVLSVTDKCKIFGAVVVRWSGLRIVIK